MSTRDEMRRHMARLRAGRRFAVEVQQAASAAPPEVQRWLAPYLATLPADLAPLPGRNRTIRGTIDRQGGKS